MLCSRDFVAVQCCLMWRDVIRAIGREERRPGPPRRVFGSERTSKNGENEANMRTAVITSTPRGPGPATAPTFRICQLLLLFVYLFIRLFFFSLETPVGVLGSLRGGAATPVRPGGGASGMSMGEAQGGDNV